MDGVISNPINTYIEKVSNKSCNNAINAIAAYLYSYLIEINKAISERKITNALIPFSVISCPNVGPKVAPGKYIIKMTYNDQIQQKEFEIVKDPRVKISQADNEDQLEFLINVRDEVSRANQKIIDIRIIKNKCSEFWCRELWIRPGSVTTKKRI